jgi:hypothetical protein
MPKYRAEYLGRDGSSPQNYRYAIRRGATLVAEYGHDFRNDEKWLEIDGKTIAVDESLLSGGGPEPLVVSESGSKLLDHLMGS